MSLLMLLPLLLVVTAAAVDEKSSSREYDVMAIYFGDWHVDPDMSGLHGGNWTEWELVINAHPRYPGHYQPNVPMEAPGFGMSAQENTPEVMELKMAAAASHGIDAMLFDWYWFTEKGSKGAGGGPFLDGALEDGFLKMKNDSGVKFALMWANQDWVDLHPAKRGWHGSYRPPSHADVDGFEIPVAGTNLTQRVQPTGSTPELLIFDGYMDATTYNAAFEYIASKYFTQDNYYKVPTKQTDGSVKMCSYFSFYQAEYFSSGVGGATAAAASLETFRKAAASLGQCLHLALMINSGFAMFAPLMKLWNVDSVTTYNFGKVASTPGWPTTTLNNITSAALIEWGALRDHYNSTYDVAFAPSFSVAWDSSPRTLKSDPFATSEYPWGQAFHSTPAEVEAEMKRALAYMDDLCGPRGAKRTGTGAQWCPPLLINAWNEWSEGAYLEPDEQFQFGKLEAIKSALSN